MGNSCTPEFWTLKDIRDSLEKESNGDKKIVIPMFQRGKRWNKDKKDTFIDSLRKRYPIGTLLFYKTYEGKQEIYTLIDGLQRGSTIKEYLSNPTKFFTMDEINEDAKKSLYSLVLANGGNIEKQKSLLNSKIEEYIHSLKSFDDINMLSLFMILKDNFPLLNDRAAEFNEALNNEFMKLRNEYTSLCSVSIPAIVYTGSEDTLPEIFERINSKGVALTEYEIYAASWPRKEFSIQNEEVIEPILKKYDLLNDSEYTYVGYDRDLKRKNKNVNSFEYVFGLSKYIQKKYGILGFYKNLKADETNPVAFQLLNACFNSSHAQIKDVHQIVLRYSSNISILENALMDSIEFVEKCISPVLKFKGNNRKDGGKIFHSQYQIMSLISFAFRKKYNIHSDNLSINEDWSENKKILKNNYWKYYVYDILTKYWGEGGTTKIHTANLDERYCNELTLGQFSTAYDSYSENFNSHHECVKVPSLTEKEYVVLNTIYLNEFSAMDQLSLDKFDVEHIATKEHMKQIIKSCNGEGLPISHIANLCYLPEFENRSKGANNFYQDKNYLNKSNLTLDLIEKKYSFTEKNDLEFMDLNYQDGDFDVLKSYYLNEFIAKRNNIMKNKFLESLGFKELAYYSENLNKSRNLNFNDQYFRTTKINNLIKEVLIYKNENKTLGINELESLQDLDFCKENLHLNTPLILLKENNSYNEEIINNHYSDYFILSNNTFIIRNIDNEDQRNRIIDYFKQIL